MGAEGLSMTQNELKLAEIAELIFQLDQAVTEEENEAYEQLTDDTVSQELRSLGLGNIAPPKSLYRLLGGAELDAAVDGQAEDERAAEPASPSTVVSFARRKPELIGRSQYMADATLPLAAATKASKVSSLTKYEGWDIRFGDWICEFYTDGRHIHVAGLPEKEVLEVKLGGKTYTLRWVPELNMHLVHGLSRRGLSETVKALQRGDETAFAVT